jgi:hypothetical protein
MKAWRVTQYTEFGTYVHHKDYHFRCAAIIMGWLVAGKGFGVSYYSRIEKVEL